MIVQIILPTKAALLAFLYQHAKTNSLRLTFALFLDQMLDMNQNILSLFSKGTHHLNRSVILTVQNVFYQNPVMRSISVNAYYLVLWQHARDISQMEMLGRQMFLRYSHLFLEAYKIATSRTYGYLFLDFRSTTPSELRTRTCVQGEYSDGSTRIFRIDQGIMDVFKLVPKAANDNYGLTSAPRANKLDTAKRKKPKASKTKRKVVSKRPKMNK